jgi:hypothetical protein
LSALRKTAPLSFSMKPPILQMSNSVDSNPVSSRSQVKRSTKPVAPIQANVVSADDKPHS